MAIIIDANCIANVFSKKSLLFLAKKTNLNIDLIKSIREPSDKFTIYAFLTKIN